MAADQNNASQAPRRRLTLAAESHAAPAHLRELYAKGDEPSLGAVAARFGISDDDECLADLIDADGRERLARALPVELARYMDAFPRLPRLRCALDAAIEMSLRSLRDRGASAGAAVESLSARFPELRGDIETARILGSLLCSTESIREQMTGSTRRLPEDFGPVLKSGRPRYELRELLGSGSHGSVFLASDRQLSDHDRPAWAAIKILSPLRDGAENEARLADEAAKARRIDHANVVRVLDRGATESDEQFVAYEYVRGGTLEGVMSASTEVPPRRAATIIAEIARGLQAAHAAGLVHCDLKPANVLMTDEGVPKIADFGIAVRLGDGRSGPGYPRLGNLAFTAPEQYREEPGAASPLADVYAAGGLLYWMLTRAYPNGATAEEIDRNLRGSTARTEAPDPAQSRPLDADLAAICRKALEPDPRRRYQSADALADDLDRWLSHTPLAWRRYSLARRARLMARREPRTLIGALAVAITAAGGLSAAVYLHQESRRGRVLSELAISREQASAAQQRLQDAKMMTSAMLSTMRALKTEEEYIPVMTAMETMFGPVFFAPGMESPDIWTPRVQIVKKLLDQAKAEGRENQLEPMLWETIYGYWQLRLGHYLEAEQALDASRKRWSAVKPGDPWIFGIEALQASLVAKQAMRDTGPDRPELLRAAADRLERLPRPDLKRTGVLIQQVVFTTRAELYGIEGLNNVREADKARDELRKLR